MCLWSFPTWFQCQMINNNVIMWELHCSLAYYADRYHLPAFAISSFLACSVGYGICSVNLVFLAYRVCKNTASRACFYIIEVVATGGMSGFAIIILLPGNTEHVNVLLFVVICYNLTTLSAPLPVWLPANHYSFIVKFCFCIHVSCHTSPVWNVFIGHLSVSGQSPTVGHSRHRVPYVYS